MGVWRIYCSIGVSYIQNGHTTHMRRLMLNYGLITMKFKLPVT